MTLKESVNTIFDRESLEESMETLIVGSTVGPAVDTCRSETFILFIGVGR